MSASSGCTLQATESSSVTCRQPSSELQTADKTSWCLLYRAASASCAPRCAASNCAASELPLPAAQSCAWSAATSTRCSGELPRQRTVLGAQRRAGGGASRIFVAIAHKLRMVAPRGDSAADSTATGGWLANDSNVSAVVAGEGRLYASPAPRLGARRASTTDTTSRTEAPADWCCGPVGLIMRSRQAALIFSPKPTACSCVQRGSTRTPSALRARSEREERRAASAGTAPSSEASSLSPRASSRTAVEHSEWLTRRASTSQMISAYCATREASQRTCGGAREVAALGAGSGVGVPHRAALKCRAQQGRLREESTKQLVV